MKKYKKAARVGIKKKVGRPKKSIEPFVEKVISDEKIEALDPSVQKVGKKSTDCVVEWCNDPIAPGQTHVCVRHQRSN